MTRDVWMEFQEPYKDHEIRHQLEPGDPRPMHTRQGVVQQYLIDPCILRSGMSDAHVDVVILDENLNGPEPIIYIKPIGKCRVIRKPADVSL